MDSLPLWNTVNVHFAFVINQTKENTSEFNIWSFMCLLGHDVKRGKLKKKKISLSAHCAGRKSRESGPSRRRLGDATLSLLLWVWLTGNMSVWWERTGMQLLPREYLHPGHLWAPLNPQGFPRLPPADDNDDALSVFSFRNPFERKGHPMDAVATRAVPLGASVLCLI